MRMFELGNNYVAVCDWIKTSYGFKHIATLLKNGDEIEETKRCYHNRTWEAYGYESVLLDLINKSSCMTEMDKGKALLILNSRINR